MWVRVIQPTKSDHTHSAKTREVVSLFNAMAAKDTTAFPQAVIALLQPEIPVSHCAVYVFRDGAAPALAYEATLPNTATIPCDAGVNYMLGHYRSDGLSRFIKTLDRREENEILAFEQSHDDISDLSYRQHCYQLCQVIDRLSVITPVFDRPASTPSWLSINLYRVVGTRPFSFDELHGAQELLSIAVSSVKTHHILRRTGCPESTIQGKEKAVLSRREAQIADLVAEGLSSKEIAIRLGILSSTVTTLRKRAYDKLGVANGKALAAAWAVR